ncbi:MAG: DNA mismatch endonuclease Vsr [Lachnospiraceae bacterium]|nr:DNA mismatch endonuclease Vsr [Lachnospiraceae bacterium]
MADIKSGEERSLNMARIRSRDTKPEVWLRKRLFKRGYRYRKNADGIAGHPDLWMKKYNTAVFVHGCFWHRHNDCKYAYKPKSRVEFWMSKFDQNIQRDQRTVERLSSQGKRVLVIWECTIKRMNRYAEIESENLDLIERFLRSESSYMEL